jgi:hypothetical protein
VRKVNLEKEECDSGREYLIWNDLQFMEDPMIKQERGTL